MKRVLISIDYDRTAKKVAEKGYELANSMNAEVILLHVIAKTSYYSNLEASPILGIGNFVYTDFSRIIDTEGLQKASQYYLEKIKHHLKDESIQIITEEGDLADTILKKARQLHVDLIVMGSHSRRWLEQVLIGSVTEKVLHHATVPLFIVPTRGKKS